MSQYEIFGLPVSPSSFNAIVPLGDIDLFQQPISKEDTFSRTGLPLDTIKAWRVKYNRRFVAILNDNAFDQLVINKSKLIDDRGEVERTIEASMQDRDFSSEETLNDARDDLMLPGLKVLETEEQKGAFLAILKDFVAIHDIRYFISKCLPLLLSRGQRRPIKGQPSTNYPKPKSQPGSGVQKRASRGRKPRRSLRIANLNH